MPRVASGKSVTAAMQGLHDRRHVPYRTTGVFLSLEFFCAFTNNDNDLFSFSSLSLSLTIARYVLLHPLAYGRSGPEASGIVLARLADLFFEMRFLIEFSPIFMRILACRLAGHPVTFLAMLRCQQSCQGRR